MKDSSALLSDVSKVKDILFTESVEGDGAIQMAAIHHHEAQILDLLQDLAETAEASAENQSALGTVDCIRFLTKLLDLECATKALLHAGLKAWMKLCRRVTLQKNTTCTQTCDISEIYMVTLVPLMRKNTEDPIIMLYGCSLVMILASDSDMRQMKFGLIGTSKVAITALESHLADPQISEMALRAIRNLSVNDGNAQQLCENQLGVPLVRILTDISQPIEVVEAALYAVINVSYSSDNAQILGGNGICLALIEAWQFWSRNLSHEFLWCVRNLSTIDSHVEYFINTNILDLVFDNIRATEESGVIQTALWACANLCCNPAMAQRCVDMGLIDLMAHVYELGSKLFAEDMNLGPVSEGICFTLYNISSALCTDHSNTQETDDVSEILASAKYIPMKEQLGGLGGCSLVSRIFARYASKEAMTELCARVIYILAENCAANQQLFNSFSTIRTLSVAMWEHRSVAETVFYVWKAMLTQCYPANTEGLRLLANETELTQHIAKTMKLHEAVEEVVILGCSLLLLLPYYTEEKKAELQEKGLIDKDSKIVVKEDREEMLRAWGLGEFIIDSSEELK